MSFGALFGVVVLLAAYGFLFARRRIGVLARNQSALKQHSQNNYHGTYVLACTFLPAFLVMVVWAVFAPLIIDSYLESYLRHTSQMSEGAFQLLLAQVKTHTLQSTISTPLIESGARYYNDLWWQARLAQTILVLLLAGVGLLYGLRRLAVRFAARHAVERILTMLMIIASIVAILTTFGIILSLVFEAARFFQHVPIQDFLFGLQWSPQTAMRADQVASEGSFGAVPIFVGTFMITAIAMAIAVPIGLFSAVYLSEYASTTMRNIAKPSIEVLAGIPTVVYGFFAALIVAPFLRTGGGEIGLSLSSESALAAGLVMGVMIIPFVSSLSDDVITAVPQSLRQGAAALGATPSETIRQVVLPAAMPGIVSAVLLAISRAIGETMIVVMAAGVAANLTANPLESVTTVTVQIVTLLVGDQEFDSAKTLAAFALGLVLFLLTLILNIIALAVVNKYRRHYE